MRLHGQLFTSACIIHSKMEMAEHIVKQILKLKPENAAGYMLLSNIYAAADNRHLSENNERQRKERGVKKHIFQNLCEESL